MANRGTAALAAILSVALLAVAVARAQAPTGAVFDEACSLVEQHFVDAELNGLDWEEECAAVRDEAAAAQSAVELAPLLNGLLAKLETSHTAFYPRGGRSWAELLDVFHPDGVAEGFSPVIEAGPFEVLSLGIVTREIEGRVFAADVYSGAPAAAAGMVVGDEIVSVGGARWTDDMPLPGAGGAPLHLDGIPLEVVIRRREEGEGGRAVTLMITPEPINPRKAFIRAQQESVRIIERDGAKVGYMRVRSFAHPDHHDLLKWAVRFGPLAEVEALVLDLRGGWGGAQADYLDFLWEALPQWQVRGRGEPWREINMAWRKPVVVLIDEGTRSGKELLAWMVRQRDLGTLVGTRTAGAVTGGRLFPLADGSLLYLAVQEVRIDGEKLEGAGVAPHIEVGFALPYAAGADPQLDAGVAEAARQVGQR